MYSIVLYKLFIATTHYMGLCKKKCSKNISIFVKLKTNPPKKKQQPPKKSQTPKPFLFPSKPTRQKKKQSKKRCLEGPLTHHVTLDVFTLDILSTGEIGGRFQNSMGRSLVKVYITYVGRVGFFVVGYIYIYIQLTSTN